MLRLTLFTLSAPHRDAGALPTVPAVGVTRLSADLSPSQGETSADVEAAFLRLVAEWVTARPLTVRMTPEHTGRIICPNLVRLANDALTASDPAAPPGSPPLKAAWIPALTGFHVCEGGVTLSVGLASNTPLDAEDCSHVHSAAVQHLRMVYVFMLSRTGNRYEAAMVPILAELTRLVREGAK